MYTIAADISCKQALYYTCTRRRRRSYNNIKIQTRATKRPRGHRFSWRTAARTEKKRVQQQQQQQRGSPSSSDPCSDAPYQIAHVPCRRTMPCAMHRVQLASHLGKWALTKTWQAELTACAMGTKISQPRPEFAPGTRNIVVYRGEKANFSSIYTFFLLIFTSPTSAKCRGIQKFWWHFWYF